MDTTTQGPAPDTHDAAVPPPQPAERPRIMPRDLAPAPMPKKKRIRLGDLIKNGDPIYISFPPRPKDGVTTGAMFQLNHPDHPDVRIKPIPMSRVPIELSNRTPHEHLKNCGDLYSAIDSGHLVLWDPIEAEEWIETHQADASDVKKRVDAFLNFERTIDPRFFGGSDFNIEDLVNQQVMQICLDVREKQISTEDGLVELIQMEPDLNENDLEYVYALSGRPALSRWAQEVSAERNKDPRYVERQEAEWRRRIDERRRTATQDGFQPETTRFDEALDSGQLGRAYSARKGRIGAPVEDDGRYAGSGTGSHGVDPSIEREILAGAARRRAGVGLHVDEPEEPVEPDGL